MNVAKLKLIEDVEDRLKDEIFYLEGIQSELKQNLHFNSLNQREVRFSELIYDESSELLVKTIDSMKSSQRVQDFQNQVKRIYKFRVDAATRDTLFEVTESPWIIHAEVVGNILERSNYNKDLLHPFFNKALPRHLRKNVWRALLTYPEAEEEYTNLFKEAKWKTISLNEVEITKKSVELLSEHCHSLAFNEKIVMTMKVVLSYIEKIIQRRLPEYMFYIMLPLMYILTDLSASLPRFVGVCLKMTEIQTTVWLSNKDTPVIEVFFQCLDQVSPQLHTKIEELIDLNFQENRVKLENFIRPFISRLSCGYFLIDTTCVVYDQLIMINTYNKMYNILALTLFHMSPDLLKTQHWDDFLVVFFKGAKKISPLQLENLLEKIPDGDDLEGKIRIPTEIKGQDYLNYVVQAQQFEEEQRGKKTYELGELISVKRILAEDPVLGLHQQKMMKGNLMEATLNKSRDTKIKRRRDTLINANLTRISLNSKEKLSGKFSPPLNYSKDSKEIVNLSGSRDIFIEENSFPKRKNLNESSKIDSFQDSSLDKSFSPLLKKQTKLIGDSSDRKNVLDSSDRKNILASNRTLKDLALPIKEISAVSGTPPRILPLDLSAESPKLDNQIVEEMQDMSYLECGILGVPNLDKIKPSLLDGFDD